MFERAVYDSEHGKWYKQGSDPWTVRELRQGEVILPFVFSKAVSYQEAFTELFSHSVVMPPPVRSPRHLLEA